MSNNNIAEVLDSISNDLKRKFIELSAQLEESTKHKYILDIRENDPNQGTDHIRNVGCTNSWLMFRFQVTNEIALSLHTGDLTRPEC